MIRKLIDKTFILAKKIYRKTIKKQPSNLEECFVALKKMLNKREMRFILESDDEKVMHRYHSSLGRYIRNEWGLWSGSKLRNYFENLGLNHPDDMSGLILCSFWRRVHNKPLNIDKQIETYQEWWKD